MKEAILIVVTVERDEPKAQDTIRSKPGSSAFSEGWERTFALKHPGSDMQHTSEDSNLCSICNDKSLN